MAILRIAANRGLCEVTLRKEKATTARRRVLREGIAT